jgi:hypothetical protein
MNVDQATVCGYFNQGTTCKRVNRTLKDLTLRNNKMKMRATVQIELEATDIMEAKTIIEQLQNDLEPIEKKYGSINLTVKERRGIKPTKRST